jgi:hypothetical protein
MASRSAFLAKRGELHLSLQVLEALCIRQLEASVAGATPGVEANILKFRSTQLTQSIAQACVDLLRRRGLPYDSAFLGGEGPDAQVFETGMIRQHITGRASTIFGGAAEVQKNIIAKAALDL